MSESGQVMAAPVLSAEDIRKSYGPVEVLHGVPFTLNAGEVHALLGENGAGKSTLVKILSGFVEPTAGTITLNGQPVTFSSMREAEEAGIILIHQEFNLAELRSVEENIFLGREIRKNGFLDKKAMRAKARELLDALNCNADVNAAVADLSVAEKQMIEIAKATSRDAKILFLDEPTAVLTPHETKSLFALIGRLKAQGVGIVFISHKLDEVEQIADRITILRDGDHIETMDARGVTQDEMARKMVGRDLDGYFPSIAQPPAGSPTVLRVEELSSGRDVKRASFALKKGEVLGLAGLQGAGRTALMEAIIGLRPVASGRIEHHGQPVSFDNAGRSKAAGIAYLTKDRKGNGLLLDKDLVWNFSLFALDKFAAPFINRSAEIAAFESAAKRFDLRAASKTMAAGSLSGGNQQKLLLAKVLEIGPEIIIIDEPTRGIDVGAKSQIYGFIADLVAAGKAVIVLSSELPEVIGLSHRVAVMHEGVLTGILEGGEINEHNIMRYATGLKRGDARDAA